MEKDIVPLNAPVMTGMSIEELEDRLEMQALGIALEEALNDTVIIVTQEPVIVISCLPCGPA
jgi:hypothetical protein